MIKILKIRQALEMPFFKNPKLNITIPILKSSIGVHKCSNYKTCGGENVLVSLPALPGLL
jgi:hypothetical protein